MCLSSAAMACGVVSVFASLTGLISPSPWPSPAKEEGKYVSSAERASSQIMDSNGLSATALDSCVPSPLAGEGQGEGGVPIIRERCEHLD